MAVTSLPRGEAKDGVFQDVPCETASPGQRNNLLVQLSEQQQPQLPTREGLACDKTGQAGQRTKLYVTHRRPAQVPASQITLAAAQRAWKIKISQDPNQTTAQYP